VPFEGIFWALQMQSTMDRPAQPQQPGWLSFFALFFASVVASSCFASAGVVDVSAATSATSSRVLYR